MSDRASNLERIRKFYEKVLGLEVLRQEANFTYWIIGWGCSGYPRVLNLFEATERWYACRYSAVLKEHRNEKPLGPMFVDQSPEITCGSG